MLTSIKAAININFFILKYFKLINTRAKIDIIFEISKKNRKKMIKSVVIG